MSRPPRSVTRRRGYRRLLGLPGEDPMGSVANLFDIAMVFAVALILALIAAMRVPDLLTSNADLTIIKNPGKPNMELILKKGVKVERYKVTNDSLSGEGRRLGVAYRLPNGEVVYVPDGTAAPGPAGRSGAAPVPAPAPPPSRVKPVPGP